MNWFFPHLVALSRPQGSGTGGAQPYSGVRQTTNQTIRYGIKAHIELDRQGQAPATKLPSDAAGQAIWKIMMKLPLGTVQTGDILTDELNNRYEVIAPDWNPMLTTCRCQILQT